MNDYDEAALFSDRYDDAREHKREDGRYSFLHPLDEVRAIDLKDRAKLVRDMRALKKQFREQVSRDNPDVNSNEYLYSSGEHRPYGRIERNE